MKEVHATEEHDSGIKGSGRQQLLKYHSSEAGSTGLSRRARQQPFWKGC